MSKAVKDDIEKGTERAKRELVMNFSFDTIKDFDAHINTSISCYKEICDAVKSLSKYFVVDDSYIYDIGCSKGTMLESIDIGKKKNVKKIGIDCSLNLLPENRSDIAFLNFDLKNEFVFTNASLILSVFTMQFLPPSRRQSVMNNIYRGLIKGGGLIFCEKIFSAHSKIQDMFTFNYYDFKAKSFSSEEILDKEKSLRDIMHPFSHEENVEMMRNAGFSVFDVFVKSFNFEGIVAIK